MNRSLDPAPPLTPSLLAGCATTPAPATIADTAARTPQLSTLNKLIADAGLAETLRGAGPFTVFAPSDEAFKAVPAKTMDELAKDKELLQVGAELPRAARQGDGGRREERQRQDRPGRQPGTGQGRQLRHRRRRRGAPGRRGRHQRRGARRSTAC